MIPVLLVVVPALVPLAVTLVNLVTWRPARESASDLGKVSALVPARDEEATIAACVTALLAEPVEEVVVLDDHSTDATPRILAEIAAREPRLRVISGRPLPPGVVGKPHACIQLAAAAVGDVLVFVDADVVVRPGGISKLVARLDDAEVVSALPAQHTGGGLEALVIAQLHLTYLSWLPLRLVLYLGDPRILAANGQILAMRPVTYCRAGGFEGVATAVVDDMAFCRAAKQAGLRVDFADGAEIADCRMYRSGADAVAGFSKNLYEGIGGSPLVLAGLTALHVACFLVPWVAWPWVPAAVLGIVANLAQRALLALRFGHPWWTVAAHPAGILAMGGVAARSWLWTRTGQIRWRGRVYAAHAERSAAAGGS